MNGFQASDIACGRKGTWFALSLVVWYWPPLQAWEIFSSCFSWKPLQKSWLVTFSQLSHGHTLSTEPWESESLSLTSLFQQASLWPLWAAPGAKKTEEWVTQEASYLPVSVFLLVSKAPTQGLAKGISPGSEPQGKKRENNTVAQVGERNGEEAFRQLCWVWRQVEKLWSFPYYKSATCYYKDCSLAVSAHAQ